MIIKKVIILCLTLALFACNNSSSLPENNSVWELVSIKNNQIDIKKKPSFVIDTVNNKIRGFAGCNRFTASYVVKNSEIEIKNIISTRMTCENYKIENQFLKLFNSVNRFKLDDGILRAFIDNKEVLKFTNKKLIIN
jgi:putative lipoprotein